MLNMTNFREVESVNVSCLPRDKDNPWDKQPAPGFADYFPNVQDKHTKQGDPGAREIQTLDGW